MATDSTKPCAVVSIYEAGTLWYISTTSIDSFGRPICQPIPIGANNCSLKLFFKQEAEEEAKKVQKRLLAWGWRVFDVDNFELFVGPKPVTETLRYWQDLAQHHQEITTCRLREIEQMLEEEGNLKRDKMEQLDQIKALEVANGGLKEVATSLRRDLEEVDEEADNLMRDKMQQIEQIKILKDNNKDLGLNLLRMTTAKDLFEKANTVLVNDVKVRDGYLKTLDADRADLKRQIENLQIVQKRKTPKRWNY